MEVGNPEWENNTKSQNFKFQISKLQIMKIIEFWFNVVEVNDWQINGVKENIKLKCNCIKLLKEYNYYICKREKGNEK